MSNPILVTRSSMPKFDEYCQEIKEMWETHWLTNMGEKHKDLQRGLQEYLGLENIDLFTVSKIKVSFGGLPEGESRIKACRLYNALYGKDIQLPGSFLVAKLKFADVEEELKENYPKEYEILNKNHILDKLSLSNLDQISGDNALLVLFFCLHFQYPYSIVMQ